MSIPDFDRAEYVEPEGRQPAVIEGYGQTEGGGLALALVYGLTAAAVGCVGYGLVASLGFMISIVAIGIGWLVAKAMMTATGGVGGRPFQVVAVGLTYLAVSCGNLVHPLWKLHQQGVPVGRLVGNPVLLRYVIAGPLLELRNGINGALGLLILFFGLRTAWQMAAGGPGLGRRVGPFGVR